MIREDKMPNHSFTWRDYSKVYPDAFFVVQWDRTIHISPVFGPAPRQEDPKIRLYCQLVGHLFAYKKLEKGTGCQIKFRANRDSANRDLQWSVSINLSPALELKVDLTTSLGCIVRVSVLN
eukprot:SAG31_NODE_1621_length_7724_cov_3.297049_2_plen_121_part_00